VFLSVFKKPVCLNISKGISVLDDIVVCYTSPSGMDVCGGGDKGRGSLRKNE
jgi:hypothetical protein